MVSQGMYVASYYQVSISSQAGAKALDSSVWRVNAQLVLLVMCLLGALLSND